MDLEGDSRRIFESEIAIFGLDQSIKTHFVLVADMKKENYVIGVDYGTDSVRSIIANAANGQEVASAVFYYPPGKMVCIVTRA